jgi:hypothetical protein
LSQGAPPEPAPAHPDDEDVSVVIRLEPHGPTTAMFVRRGIKLAVVRELAVGRVAPSMDGSSTVIARGGAILDEEKTVGELHLRPLEYLSVGTKADIETAATMDKPRA